MPHNPLLSPERERQLLASIQGGDRGALGELLGAYNRRVYHVCLRMVGNADDAAELTQDVLLRAVQHIQTFRGNSRFSTWLLRIAMNLAISHHRRAAVRATVSLDADGASDDGGRPDQASALKAMIASERELRPDRSVEIQEQGEQLIAALESLDMEFRTVILLRDLQDMDYQQIAEVLSLPVGTVKSRLFRARLALRQAINTRSRRPSEVADG